MNEFFISIIKNAMMKRLALLVTLGIFVFNPVFGQDAVRYSKLTTEALKLYDAKEYLKSAQKYSEAFIVAGDEEIFEDRYNAACSWALASVVDSSFVQLFKIVRNGNYSDLEEITSDSDLRSLHEDERWGNIIRIVKLNKEKAESNLDRSLVAILDTIFREDQEPRQQISAMEEQYGWQSDEVKAFYKMIYEQDSINLIKVKNILDDRGWLGADIIGKQGNLALFAVIQHADIKTQEKYLPMMTDAVKKGNADPCYLALLVDRVALRKGQKQIYGSQIARDEETGEYYVQPLIDPENVDKRRAEVGLKSIQDYVSRWGITWNVEEYKKK